MYLRLDMGYIFPKAKGTYQRIEADESLRAPWPVSNE